MLSSHFIFIVGLGVSVFNVILWVPILRSQFKQFKGSQMNNRIKVLLLIFGFVSIFSNITPIWFDIYRLVEGTPISSNVAYAYVTSQYLYRTVTAIMFWLIYKD